jgi:hypothetical protein
MKSQYLSRRRVAVSRHKAKCKHIYVLFFSVVAQLLGGSADGGRDEKMSHYWYFNNIL